MTDDKIDLDNMLASKRVDATADYLARGRKYSGLADAELKETWMASWRRMAKTPDSKLRAALASIGDLEGEFVLRGLPVPEDLVKAEAVSVGKRATRRFVKMIEADPALFEEIGADLVREVDEFRAAKARSQN
jgi:hypothetical protein